MKKGFTAGEFAVLSQLPEGGMANPGIWELLGRKLPIVHVFPVICTCGKDGDHSPGCAVAENYGSDQQVVLQMTKNAQLMVSGAYLKTP